jgi:phage-related protein
MGSVLSGIGDFVGDIIEFAVDDILKPVFEVVGDVVGGMLDDPLGTILTVASFIPGPWTPYIWVAKTALALSRGDLIGAALSVELATPTFTEAVIIGAAKGLVMPAISSLARGGDLEDITKAAFISGLGSGAAAAFSYRVPTGQILGAEDEGYSAEVTGAKEIEAGYEEYKTIVDSIGDGISDLATGFKDLPPIIQEIIKNTTASTVTAAISGGDVDLADILPAVLAKAATKVYFTEGIIKDAYISPI